MAAALLQAERLRERLLRRFAVPDAVGAGRRFRLSAGAVLPEEDRFGAPGDAPGDIVAVPTELVLLLAVELPLPTARRRLEALPFAIEDRIADPLDAVHVALGPQIAPQQYLAAVVRHRVMRDWIATIEAGDAPAAALVPDALLLPMPAPGQWSVAIEGERALVRSGDGTGFAIARAQFETAWAAGGRPPLVAWSGDVPQALGATLGDPASAETGRGPPVIDLRQGPYAYRRPALSGLRRRALTIAGAGILAHGAIATADTLVLRHQAQLRATQTQALVASAFPSVAIGDGGLSAVVAGLPVSPRAGAPDPLLPMLARVSAAAGSVAMNKFDYDRRTGRLILSVAPGSEAGLAARLSGAGLAAAPAPGIVVVSGTGA